MPDLIPGQVLCFRHSIPGYGHTGVLSPIRGDKKLDVHSFIKCINKSYLCSLRLFNVSLTTSTATSLRRLKFNRFTANDR